MRGGNGQGARSSSHQRKREQQLDQQDAEKQQMLKVTYGTGVHSLKLNQTQEYSSGPAQQAFTGAGPKISVQGGPSLGPHGQAVGQHGPKISTQI